MRDQRGPNGSAPSRRDFLKGSGAAAAAAALATAPLPAATELADEASVPAVGPGAVRIQLNVDGKKMSQSVEPRVTLLDALRNYLDVTGCKRVCDRAPTALHRDARRQANLLVHNAGRRSQGHEIKTAESLFADGKLDAVPAAFAKYDAQQCGFCTPGFVVAMRAAFDKNPQASQAEIEEALSGNICRCGTYSQMRDAIASLCKSQGKGE